MKSVKDGLLGGILVSGLLFAPGAAFAEGEPVAAGAGENGRTTQNFKDWTLVCETPEGAQTEVCFINQLLAVKETGKQIMLATVSHPGKGDTPVLFVTLPLGVFLAPGMAIGIDDGEVKQIPYDRCTPLGCSAALPLEQGMLEAMKKGSQAKVIFMDGQRKKVGLPISLTGFTAAVSSLRK
ncbi:MAG: invasion associated locus B family protein [Candidatus Sedimenticola endophacoides]